MSRALRKAGVGLGLADDWAHRAGVVACEQEGRLDLRVDKVVGLGRDDVAVERERRDAGGFSCYLPLFIAILNLKSFILNLSTHGEDECPQRLPQINRQCRKVTLAPIP